MVVQIFCVSIALITLRVAGEMLPIPAGPDCPHQIMNTSDAPLKYLSASTRAEAGISEYPDSQKYMGYTKRGISGSETLLQGGRMHRLNDDLDYWDGELSISAQLLPKSSTRMKLKS